MSAGTEQAPPMRVWVTRPEEDARTFARALRDRGFSVLIAPLLRIVVTQGPPLDLGGVQALLATSANGVRAFSARSSERTLPLLAVGDATARAARAHGFVHVSSASGDVAALASLVRQTLDPAAGALLHPAAGTLAGDLGGALRAAGFGYRREVLYEARTADALPEAVQAALCDGSLDAVAVFSPRTGRTLVRLVSDAGLAPAAAELCCLCLSAAVAESVTALRWRRVVVAAQPHQAALIEAAQRALLRKSEDLRMDSASSTGYFTATLETMGNRPTAGDGGMSSQTNKDQQQGPETNPDVLPSPDAAQEPGPGKQAPAAPELAADSAPAPLGADSGAADRPKRTVPPSGDGGSEPPASRPWGDHPAEAAAPAAAPAATGAPSQQGGSSGLRSALWAIVALAVLAAAGAAAWYGYFLPRQQQQVADAEPDPALAAAEAALGDLDARYTRLRQQLDSVTPRLDALERNVATLRQSVESLGSAPQQSAVDEAALQALAERTARLENQTAAAASLAQQVRALEASTAMARDTASKLATTVLAVGQLAQAVQTGEPFVRELASVRALGGDDAEIAQAAVDLQKWSAAGVPTLAMLTAAFPETAEAVARAEPVTAGDNWTNRVVDRLASLVSIRRTGEQAIAAGGVDGALATTAMALDHGDLQGAVTTLEGMEGAPRQAAEDWLAKARSRIEADRVLSALRQRAIARLSSAQG